MSTQAFYDSQVTTARYQVLCVKRDYEAIVQDEQTVVVQTMDEQGFVAWQIANFVQRANLDGVPLGEAALKTLEPISEIKGGRFFRFCDPNDNQYLRVEVQVLSSVARQEANYAKDKTKALQQIAFNLGKNKPSPPDPDCGKDSNSLKMSFKIPLA